MSDEMVIRWVIAAVLCGMFTFVVGYYWGRLSVMQELIEAGRERELARAADQRAHDDALEDDETLDDGEAPNG
jgi:hypothetical protein